MYTYHFPTALHLLFVCCLSSSSICCLDSDLSDLSDTIANLQRNQPVGLTSGRLIDICDVIRFMDVLTSFD